MTRVPAIYWSTNGRSNLSSKITDRISCNKSDAILNGLSITVLGIHGVGIVGDTWVSTVTEAQKYFDGISSFDPDAIGSSIRGSLTIYLWDPSNAVAYVLTDPLGGGIVFKFETHDSIMVSSGITTLVENCKSMGFDVRKSLSYTASYVGTGSGGLIESSYEGVGRLDQFTYLRITDSGVNECTYSARDYVYDSSFKYVDMLERIKDEVATNLRLTIEHDNEMRIAHLTGGIDSRLVLGAIKSLNFEDKFRFYCSGNENEPDQKTAKGLSSTLGIQMTKHSGVESNKLADDLRDQLLSPLVETGGIVGGPARSHLSKGNRLILSGGYGELLRSFYSKGYEFDGDTRSAATKIFGSGAFHNNPRSALLSEKAISKTVAGMDSLIAQGKHLGLKNDALLDSLYFTARNRYFVGEISRSMSPYASRFDPLYSLSLARLGLHARLDWKSNGVVGLDLLKSFSEDLIGLPFDSERITAFYEDLRGTVPRRPMADGRAVYDGNVAPSVSTRPTNSPSRPTDRDVEIANALRTSPRLVAQNGEVRKRLRILLSGISDAELAAGFNPIALRKLVNTEPSHRVHLRSVMKLYASLEWYFAE